MGIVQGNYYIVYDWMVSELRLAGTALHVFALLYGLCEANGGTASVSNSYIMQRCGIGGKHCLLNTLAELAETGVITRHSGDGRGNKSTYSCNTKKGAEMTPFTEIKGAEMTPERVPILHEKGAEMTPHIINNNKNNINSTTTHAREEILQAVSSWLTDNELSLGLLLHQCGLISQPTTEDGELQRIAAPYISRFVDGELAAGTDFERKGRTDTKRHFAAWLRKQSENKPKKQQTYDELTERLLANARRRAAAY